LKCSTNSMLRRVGTVSGWPDTVPRHEARDVTKLVRGDSLSGDIAVRFAPIVFVAVLLAFYMSAFYIAIGLGRLAGEEPGDQPLALGRRPPDARQRPDRARTYRARHYAS
jgi:hypothetical protein